MWDMGSVVDHCRIDADLRAIDSAEVSDTGSVVGIVVEAGLVR